jgi:hypothetical protein
MENKAEYAVIKNAVRTLCVVCAANEDKVIDLLTEYLWTQEEAGEIKRSDGRFDIERLCDEKRAEHDG